MWKKCRQAQQDEKATMICFNAKRNKWLFNVARMQSETITVFLLNIASGREVDSNFSVQVGNGHGLACNLCWNIPESVKFSHRSQQRKYNQHSQIRTKKSRQPLSNNSPIWNEWFIRNRENDQHGVSTVAIPFIFALKCLVRSLNHSS